MTANGEDQGMFRDDAIAKGRTSDIPLHVVPVADAIEHDLDDECTCGPRIEIQPNGNTLVIHHSLDGREANE
jgi:hypothetical protein